MKSICRFETFLIVSNAPTKSSYSLADSANQFASTQYGGIYFTYDLSSKISGNDINFTDAIVEACLGNKGDYLNASECDNYAGIGYAIQYNFTALHATPLYQSLADEAIVREAIDDTDFKIQTVLHALPQTRLEEDIGKADDGFSAWFLITLSFPFITGAFATFVVAERESKAKHLQTVAGVRPEAYWLSTWLWDVANYQIPMWLTVALMFIFNVEIITTSERGVFGGILCLLILFGPAAASFTYCVTFMFNSPSVCNLVIIIFGFLVGLGGTMAGFILLLIGSDPANPNPSLVDASNIVAWVLRFFPPFCLSKGLFNAINIETYELLAGEPITVWDDSVLLYEVIFLAWQSVVYLFLAMKIDQFSSNPRARSLLSCGRKPPPIDVTTQVSEDDDVIAEQERVLNGGANDDLIVLSQLTKVYNNGKVAVNNMSLGIPPGQCFGLLGINGAGKLTKYMCSLEYFIIAKRLTFKIISRQDHGHGNLDSGIPSQ